jgi:hypothetical protein
VIEPIVGSSARPTVTETVAEPEMELVAELAAEPEVELLAVVSASPGPANGRAAIGSMTSPGGTSTKKGKGKARTIEELDSEDARPAKRVRTSVTPATSESPAPGKRCVSIFVRTSDLQELEGRLIQRIDKAVCEAINGLERGLSEVVDEEKALGRNLIARIEALETGGLEPNLTNTITDVARVAPAIQLQRLDTRLDWVEECLGIMPAVE